MSRAPGPEPATATPPPVPLRRNRGFRLLWIGQVVSSTGTEASLIAYPLLILALTHSPAIAGLVGTAQMIAANILLAPTGNAVLLAAMQRATPQDMRGRANSALYQASMSLAALAPLASGLLVEHFSGQWAMAAFAAAMGVAAILAVAMPGLADAG